MYHDKVSANAQWCDTEISCTPIGQYFVPSGVQDGVFSQNKHTTSQSYLYASRNCARFVPGLTSFVLSHRERFGVIRPLLLQAFGGAIAPRVASRLPRRYFANTMTTTETTMQANGEMAGVIHGQGHGDVSVQENGKRRKLHGRAFYESIGSPKLVLAPMVEQSEFVCLFNSIQLAWDDG